MYTLGDQVKSFAIDNGFTQCMNKVCYRMGVDLRPFCMFADEFQSKHNVADLTLFGGLQDKEVTIIEDVVESRREALEKDGIHLPTELTPELKKTLFYQYLMTVAVCYVEVEKWKTVNGEATKTYDKLLCTRNPLLMGAWMGKSAGDMRVKYSTKITAILPELLEGRLRLVRLNQSAKGNTISVPRNEYYSKTMKCIPLFMLYAFTEGIKKSLETDVVRFTFLKDNHTEREMCSTVNAGILQEVYQDNAFVSGMLGGIDINSVKQGGMLLSSKANRGYIKIPELGASIYDATGTRSLNIARVLKMEKVSLADVDLSYVRVSLDSVVENFINCLDYMVANGQVENLKRVYKDVMEAEPTAETSDVSMVGELSAYARQQEGILSTTYKRWLHSYMIKNPDMFPYYTGSPVSGGTTAPKNYGVEEMDF